MGTLWNRFDRLRGELEVLRAVELALRVVAVEGVAAEPQIRMAVVTLEAGPMQRKVLRGDLFHKIDALLAKVTLFRNSR